MTRLILCAIIGACTASVEPEPSATYCARVDALGCAIDCEREPTPERCDLSTVEACVALLESAPTCDEAERIARESLCYAACTPD